MQAIVAEKEGIGEDVLQNLPDAMQEVILNHAKGQEKLDKKIGNNAVIKTVVNDPLVKALVYEDAFEAPVNELRDLTEALENGKMSSFYARHKHFMGENPFRLGMHLIKESVDATHVLNLQDEGKTYGEIVDVVINTYKDILGTLEGKQSSLREVK